MSDKEGDSQMLSSPSNPEEERSSETTSTTANLHTPLDLVTDLPNLSPPNSQGGVPVHTALPSTPSPASAASLANSNGKRPIQSLEGNESIDHGAIANGTTGMAGRVAGGKVHTDQLSGYTWQKAEDEPGYSWMNKKAQDEAARAWDGLLDKDKRMGNRYNDPFETAERELALLNRQAKP